MARTRIDISVSVDLMGWEIIPPEDRRTNGPPRCANCGAFSSTIDPLGCRNCGSRADG